MKEMENLRFVCRRLVGSRINRCSLLIWPDSKGVSETDTRLHLEFEDQANRLSGITIGIGADGQTPAIENETWCEEYSLNDLQMRIEEWSKPEFWSAQSSHRYESFSVHNSNEFRGVVGAKITNVSILCFEDEQMEPTGVFIQFETGASLWVVPGMRGASVCNKEPEKHLEFPFKAIPVI